jgi:hypothetical protein
MERVAVADLVAYRIEDFPHWPLTQWQPDVPGRIDHIYTHWSAHDYASVFPAYHFCIATTPDGIVVVNTHDVRENMRNVYENPDAPYAQHTRGRNSHALGISIMAMQDATPANFGAYPLTEELVNGLCVVGARLAAFYNVPIARRGRGARRLLRHRARSALGYRATRRKRQATRRARSARRG